MELPSDSSQSRDRDVECVASKLSLETKQAEHPLNDVLHRYRPAPSLRLEPLQQEEEARAQAGRQESPRAEARCAPAAQAASPDSRASAQSTQQHLLLQRWASGSLAGHSQQQEQSSRFRAQHLAWQHGEAAPRPQPSAPIGGQPLLCAQLPLSSAAAHQLHWQLGVGASLQPTSLQTSTASVNSWQTAYDHSINLPMPHQQQQQQVSGAPPSLHRRAMQACAADVSQHQPQGARDLECGKGVSDWHLRMAGNAARSDYSRAREQPTTASGFVAGEFGLHAAECPSFSSFLPFLILFDGSTEHMLTCPGCMERVLLLLGCCVGHRWACAAVWQRASA